MDPHFTGVSEPPPSYNQSTYNDQSAQGSYSQPAETGYAQPVNAGTAPHQGYFPPAQPGYAQSINTGNLPQQGYGHPTQPGYVQPVKAGYAPYAVTAQPMPVQPVAVIPGRCSQCNGYMREDYTMAGYILAIICFPIGILCCLLLRERRCMSCGNVGY